MRYWRLILPILGKDGKPTGGRTRERMPASLTQRQAEEEARRRFLRLLRSVDDSPAAPAPKLLETLLRYYETVTCGPAPKAPGTQRIDLATIQTLVCWMLDREAGRKKPSRPADLLPNDEALRKLLPRLDVPLDSFGWDEADALRAYLAKRMSATGANMQLRSLRAMLRWAVRRRLITWQPISAETMLDPSTRTAGARTAPGRKRHYTLAEVARLDAAADPDLRRWIRVSYLTGARAGEVGALSPADLLVEEGLLRIPAGKTDSHVVLLTPALQAALDGWSGWPHLVDWYRERISTLAGELGIEAAWPLHALRHALITGLRQAGARLEDVAAWVGQVGPGAQLVTREYDHAQREALQRVADLMPIPWAGGEVVSSTEPAKSATP